MESSSCGLLYRMSVPSRLLRRFFVNIVFSGNCSVEIGEFDDPWSSDNPDG